VIISREEVRADPSYSVIFIRKNFKSNRKYVDEDKVTSNIAANLTIGQVEKAGGDSKLRTSELSRKSKYMIKKLLAAVGLLISAALSVPILLPSKFSMSRSIEIDAPVSFVFSRLTDLNEYMKWNPFPEGDPTNTAEVSGSGVGSYLTWKGKKTGEGKMTIANIEINQKISIKMDFYKPMSGEGMVHWITSQKSDKTTEMTWIFDQDLPYFNRYFGLFMDKMMGKHFERGLTNFKTLIETTINEK
jgi:uncharacterized protein YndB with AHSA1/START domain